MRMLGEQHGYIVVQPNGPLNNWNWDPLGHPCTGLALPNATPGKQTCFVPPFDKEPAGDRAINNWVQEALEVKAWNIDRNRVHKRLKHVRIIAEHAACHPATFREAC